MPRLGQIGRNSKTREVLLSSRPAAADQQYVGAKRSDALYQLDRRPIRHFIIDKDICYLPVVSEKMHGFGMSRGGKANSSRLPNDFGGDMAHRIEVVDHEHMPTIGKAARKRITEPQDSGNSCRDNRRLPA